MDKEESKHKVFISYHHKNDKSFKKKVLKLNEENSIFIDKSIDTGDIDTKLKDETIRVKIRDEYLRDSTVTIVLVGDKTKNRKHIDWEIYSSMIDGSKNKKSGILIIYLDSTNINIKASHDEEEKDLYPNSWTWTKIGTRKDEELKYPNMPPRIIDNLLKDNVQISITNWKYIKNDHELLKKLIDLTFKSRENCEYDLSREMKKKNS